MITVNGYSITEKEFDLACNDFKRRLQTRTLTKDYVESVKDQLIDARLLLESAKIEKTIADTSEIDEVYKKIIANFTDENQFKEVLASEGDTVESLKEKIADDLILKQFINERFVSQVEVADDDVISYYNENKENFKMQSKIKASHILFEEKDLETAKQVKQKIANGSDFAEMAKEHSKCPSSENGGDLGYFSKGQMVPEFEQVAFKADIGIVTDPVKTQFGYHLITVYDKQGEKIEEFDNIKEDLKNHLKNTLINFNISEETKKLRETAKISVEESKVESKYNK